MKSISAVAISFLAFAFVVHPAHGFSINEMMKGDTSTMYTPSDYGYDYFYLEVYIQDFVVFSVRACSDVHIALLQERLDMTFNATEVVIGGWYNARSVFRNGTLDEYGGKNHFMEFETPDVLHCTEFRTFWLQWGLRLRVGKGPIPGEQVFMDMERAWYLTHAIQFIAFCTGYGNTGVWKLPENQGHALIVNTPDDYRYEYLWKTTDYKNNHILFAVNSCNDMHINLTPIEGRTHYEVVLAGWANTRSAIRRFGGELNGHDEAGVASCEEMRFFWISWEAGSIQVGKGAELGRNRFLMANETEFPGVNFLSISTGWGAKATWVFDDDLENYFKYFTHSEGDVRPRYNVFATTSRVEWFTFVVQGCSDIWLVFTESNGIVAESSYQLNIGMNNNTRTAVRTGPANAQPVNETATPNILNCIQPSLFWVSWFNGEGRFGYGNLIGFFEILRWNMNITNARINSLGFSSTHSNGGFFLARKNTADSFVVYSSANLGRRQMWFSVRQDLLMRFRVRACHSVRLTLSGIIDLPEVQTYEVEIGRCYQARVLDRIDEDSRSLATVNITDVLSCTEFRSFWVSWVDGYIRLGTGFAYRNGQILQMEQRKPHPINAVSVSTIDGAGGVYELEADVGDYLLIVSLSGETTMKWFHLHVWTRWFYFQVAGIAAHLVLGARYQDPMDVYNIYIGGDGNTECSLWKGSKLLQRRSLPLVLGLNDMRDFWVSWDERTGKIRFGESKQRDVGIILDYFDSSPFTITAMALAGDRGSYAQWKIWEDIALEMSMTTLQFEFFNQAWWSVRHRSSIMFALQACARAEIALSALMHEFMLADQVYTLVMNDEVNNMTSIWRGNRGRRLIEVSMPDILSCDKEQFYWLSWHDGHIALGRGKEKGKQTVIAYQDLDASPISAIAFTTYNGVGNWRMPLTYDDFVVVPARRLPDVLSGAEIFGTVFGAILVVVVFGTLLLLILAPNRAGAIVTTVRERLPGGSGQPATTQTVNPSMSMTGADFTEVAVA